MVIPRSFDFRMADSVIARHCCCRHQALDLFASDWCPLTVAVEEVQNAPTSRGNQPKKVEERTSCLPSQDLFPENSLSSLDCP